ncbi:MAG: beta-glucosidase BglX [Muribaculaceae bacterium]|jgi:beta-glucosidase|nr:beta-glucosidase BglX [Muribaculaceae bacterium]
MKSQLLEILAVSAFSILTVSTSVAKTPVYKDSKAPIEQRVEDLLSQMTMEEKLGQLSQINSFNDPKWNVVLYQNIKDGKIGSIINEVNGKRIDSLQRMAVKQSRLGIPVLFGRDVIHGYKTIFPIPLGQAATFDPEVIAAGAHAAAVESSSDGIRWTFSPMVDISRDPRWGRIAESAGEDPYLASVVGSAMIKGYQGANLSDATSIAACAKHFFGYGASEGGRDYNSTFIPERTMRNVYLPPFESAVKAGAATFMTSFNDNDGIPASANHHILTDILRGEWGFKGFVVSDWSSITEMINHGFCSDAKDAACKSANAGVDMDMVSGCYLKYLPELVNEGKVPMSVVDNAVRNVLRIKFQLGLFEHPFISTPQTVKYSAENLAAAKQSAEESVIMLKNEGDVLPLTSGVTTLAVVGPLANAPYEQMGTWTFDGEKSHTVTPLNAIKSMFGKNLNIIYEPALAYSRDNSTEGIAKAVDAAKRADVVLAFVGEEAILSGEAHCLASLNLVGAQSQLISALAATGKPVVTVVMAGRPLTIGKQLDESKAMLYCFHPGTMGGEAIADILFGKASPSGKTPVTFPKSTGQIPIYYCHNNTGRPANRTETLIDKIPVEAGQTSLGCTSFLLDDGFDPLVPFGFGLSYGKFSYSGITLDKSTYSAGDVIHASVTLANAGSHDATEVAQLYIRDKVGSVTRPVKELKAFRRVALKAGESTRVDFELPVSDLAFYGIDMKRTVEPGDFTLWIGTDSNASLSASFSVK